jgi:hypothetical protein
MPTAFFSSVMSVSMAPSPNINRVTQRNFAEEIRSAFSGPYATDSPEYLMASTFAAHPPIYDRTLIRFCYKRTTGPSPFLVGSPITVTYEPLHVTHRGRALYGLVREIIDTLDTIYWSGTVSKMTVEVHCIPNFLINWNDAVPWVLPPPGAVFVQPHGFTHDLYRPRSLYAAALHDIVRLPMRLRPLPDTHDFYFRLLRASEQDRLPQAHEYVQHPSEDDDHTVLWNLPTAPSEYILPHGFLTPDASSSPDNTYLPLPLSDVNVHQHDGIGENDIVNDEGSVSEAMNGSAGEQEIEAIYQLEVDIAEEVLNADSTPPASLSSTPDSMPPLRLVGEDELVALEVGNGTSISWTSPPPSAAPPVSPALFTLVTTTRPSTSIAPPPYTAISPPHLRTIPYVPPPPLRFEPLPTYQATPSAVATPTIPPSLLHMVIAGLETTPPVQAEESVTS